MSTEAYRWELHCHSSGISPCADADVTYIARAYAEAGYHGIVLANHLYHTSYRGMNAMSWEEKVELYMEEHRDLIAAAKPYGLTVLLGAEVRLDHDPNDYLLYGVTEDFLIRSGDLCQFRLAELSTRAREAGILLVQAHPFRHGMEIVNPALLDGIEVFNGHYRHDSANDIAQCWAKRHSLISTSGSDFHERVQQPNGGIITEHRIQSETDLVGILRAGTYRLCETTAS